MDRRIDQPSIDVAPNRNTSPAALAVGLYRVHRAGV